MWSLGFSVKVDDEPIVPALVSNISLVDMSASIDVKMLNGAAYGFITDIADIASLKRVEDLFSFSVSTSVATRSHEAIQTRVEAAYGGTSAGNSL